MSVIGLASPSQSGFLVFFLLSLPAYAYESLVFSLMSQGFFAVTRDAGAQALRKWQPRAQPASVDALVSLLKTF